MSVMALFTHRRSGHACAPCWGFAIALRVAAGFAVRIGPGRPGSCKAYVVPDYDYFSFFPWAAYLAFGMSAGSMIRLLPHGALPTAPCNGAPSSAVGLILACQYFANLPFSLYPKSEFWLNSPAQVSSSWESRCYLALAFLWTRYAAKPGWSWVRQFGTTSLLVYWVHIELVYGRWLPWCKNNLDVGQTVLAAIIVIVLMLLLATAKTYRKDVAAYLSGWRWGWSAKPERVPAD